MANLSETVASRTNLAVPSKSFRTCRTKNDLSFSAAAAGISRSERFFLVKMPIRKLPLLSIESSASSDGAIVVDSNSRRRKATGSGFIPKVIIVKGLTALQAAKAENKGFCNVWVGEKAIKKLHISAEDSIGANALQSKLQRVISEKYKNQKSAKAGDSYSPSPWIEEIFPYDGYFVFRYDGENYRCNFILDKKTQEPSLSGEPVKAVVKYVAVSASSLADALYGDNYVDKTMSQELMFDPINHSNAPLGALSYSPQIVPDGTFYPAGSELGRPELRTMLNVREALDIFLSVLKDGMKGPLQQMFQPVTVPTDKFWINASREAEIVAKEMRRKINIPDFINWQHYTLTKRSTPLKYGLAASAWAYVGDAKDISTWHLQADSMEQIKKSLKLIMHCAGIPDGKKTAIQGKLKALLKKAAK